MTDHRDVSARGLRPLEIVLMAGACAAVIVIAFAPAIRLTPYESPLEREPPAILARLVRDATLADTTRAQALDALADKATPDELRAAWQPLLDEGRAEVPGWVLDFARRHADPEAAGSVFDAVAAGRLTRARWIGSAAPPRRGPAPESLLAAWQAAGAPLARELVARADPVTITAIQGRLGPALDLLAVVDGERLTAFARACLGRPDPPAELEGRLWDALVLMPPDFASALTRLLLDRIAAHFPQDGTLAPGDHRRFELGLALIEHLGRLGIKTIRAEELLQRLAGHDDETLAGAAARALELLETR